MGGCCGHKATSPYYTINTTPDRSPIQYFDTQPFPFRAFRPRTSSSCCHQRSRAPLAVGAQVKMGQKPPRKMVTKYWQRNDSNCKWNKRLRADAAEEPPTGLTCTLSFASISTVDVDSDTTFHTAVQYCGSAILPLSITPMAASLAFPPTPLPLHHTTTLHNRTFQTV